MIITCPECQTRQHALAGRHTCRQCRTDLRIRPNLRRMPDGTVKARKANVVRAWTASDAEPYRHAAERNSVAPVALRESREFDRNGASYMDGQCQLCGEWTRADHIALCRVPNGGSKIEYDIRPKTLDGRGRVGELETAKAEITRWRTVHACGLCRIAAQLVKDQIEAERAERKAERQSEWASRATFAEAARKRLGISR